MRDAREDAFGDVGCGRGDAEQGVTGEVILLAVDVKVDCELVRRCESAGKGDEDEMHVGVLAEEEQVDDCMQDDAVVEGDEEEEEEEVESIT